MRKKTVVLASGGIDSSTVLALAKAEGFALYALTIDYGQRHRHELAAACGIVEQIGAEQHLVTRIDLRAFGGSALTADVEVPKGRATAGEPREIPVTYVPARNTVFLSLALAWCESLGAEDIFIGVNAVDYSGYPDCRPEFLRRFERLAEVATRDAIEDKARYRIHAPLLHMSKADIILAGHAAGVDFGLTHSCYDPDDQGRACGSCDSCSIRREGFIRAGLPDPTRYA